MKKDRTLRIVISVVAVFAVVLAVILLSQSGVLTKDPSVDVKADNSYSETLYVITDDDYSPYSFYDKDGNYSGHDVELINMIANKLGMNLDLEFMEWEEGIAATLADKAQVLMTCDYSDSFGGTDHLLKTEPISFEEYIVFSKNDLNSVDELYGKKIAIMRDGNVTVQVNMLNLHKYCIEYSDNREAMKALINGDVDYAIMRNSVGRSILKELPRSGVQGEISIGRSYMCFGINENHPELVEKLNGAIEDFKKQGDIVRLKNKWLTSFVQPQSVVEVVRGNLWIGALIVLMAIGLAVMAYRIRVRKLEATETQNRYIQIVENLSNDFECVNAVDLTSEAEGDTAQLLRISDELTRIIPEWATETNFTKRLQILGNTIVAPEDRDRYFEQTKRAVVLDALLYEDAYYVKFKAVVDGVVNYYQLKFSAVMENGEMTGIVCGLHNIDEDTKKDMAVQEELKSAKEQLEAANKAKTDFLFNMSHDIRTPMNAIIGFTELAQKHLDDEERVGDYLGKIETSGNHLLNLINEVLDMSRVEAGKLKSDIKVVSIRGAAEANVTICRENAAQRNIRLSFIDEGITHDLVLADELHVNQIVMNIMSNAIKYTMPGGSVVYTISEIDSDVPGMARYRFIVRDTGIGMSEEFLTRIFDSFSREENEAVNGIQGTGLGMSIVKRLVDYLDGTIDIKSEKGRGTTVTLEFHFQIAEGKDAAAPSVAVEGLEELEQKLAGKKVLLVEDNDLNREIARELLEEHGMIVAEAVNGLEAVNAVRHDGVDAYDIVLMDIQMPFMNGYEATAEIRKLPGAEKLTIIALSANAFEEDRKASLDAGMNEHVAKPINITQLVETMAEFL